MSRQAKQRISAEEKCLATARSRPDMPSNGKDWTCVESPSKGLARQSADAQMIRWASQWHGLEMISTAKD